MLSGKSNHNKMKQTPAPGLQDLKDVPSESDKNTVYLYSFQMSSGPRLPQGCALTEMKKRFRNKTIQESFHEKIKYNTDFFFSFNMHLELLLLSRILKHCQN